MTIPADDTIYRLQVITADYERERRDRVDAQIGRAAARDALERQQREHAEELDTIGHTNFALDEALRRLAAAATPFRADRALDLALAAAEAVMAGDPPRGPLRPDCPHGCERGVIGTDGPGPDESRDYPCPHCEPQAHAAQLLRQQVEDLRTALADVEWAGGVPASCPQCGRHRTTGHRPTCIVGLALGTPPGPSDESLIIAARPPAPPPPPPLPPLCEHGAAPYSCNVAHCPHETIPF